EARPVPVGLRQAARAALQDEASAVLLDVAGPVMFVVEKEDLGSLAQGHRLVRVQDRWAWVTPGGPHRETAGDKRTACADDEGT
ncbi:MAG: hypothetical protein ABIR34_09600, partial [Marmoricola sp.]